MSRRPVARMSYAEYVTAEQHSELRHEFLHGEVFAMAGATPLHAALAAALIQHLGNALRGKPCRVYSSDLRVRIRETGLTTYPDLSVVCGKLETDIEDPNAGINPVVLIEMLSESSEAYDRGAKAAHYRRIPSLREYVLVSQLEPAIEVFRRNERGNFELIEARKGERIELAALGVTLDVDAIYADPLAQNSSWTDQPPR
jgi:Uma2 family endonuclease